MSKTYRKKPKEVLKTQQEFEKICDFLDKLLNINYSLSELHDLLKFDFYHNHRKTPSFMLQI